MFDEYVHEVFKRFGNNGVRWHDFHEVGIDESYYDYYYAESMLYVIRDRLMNTYYFVEARSPGKALAKYKEHMDDVMKVGAYSGEDE